MSEHWRENPGVMKAAKETADLRAQLATAQAEVAAWKKATGYDDAEALDFFLGRAGLRHHWDVQADILAKANARCEEYKREVERRDELLRVDGYAEAMALATQHLARAEAAEKERAEAKKMHAADLMAMETGKESLRVELAAAEQKVKELEATLRKYRVNIEADERARIREGLEKLPRYDWDVHPMPNGEYVDRADALALVEKP